MASRKNGSIRAIIKNMLPALPSAERVNIYVGIPIAAAVPKHISWRLVRLNAILVFILDRSLGTFTYAIG